MYNSLLIKSYNINCKYRNFQSVSLINFILNRFANIFIPIFFILKIKPNIVTIINFIFILTSLILIFFYNEYFILAVLFYFIYLVFDQIDGGLARLYKKKTFFGKFIDSSIGVFFEGFFYIGLSLFFFNLKSDKLIFIFCLFSSFLYIFDVFILDKFSSLVRWCNEENNNKFSPYIRRKKFLRMFLTFYDMYVCLILILPFFLHDLYIMENVIILIFSILFLSAVFNISLHAIFAYKFLNFKKK
jgi:phosphatidylglycerophosphate synthase